VPGVRRQSGRRGRARSASGGVQFAADTLSISQYRRLATLINSPQEVRQLRELRGRLTLDRYGRRLLQQDLNSKQH
jgi:hypothetical protein